MKSPVFQSLLYEKACVSRYGEKIDCSNVSLIHTDEALQSDANHLYLISSFCLLLPSIFTSLFLGSLCDTWNAKIPMMIPFLGLILGDINYLFQTVYIHNNVYYLMISDILYGCCGGFTAIIDVKSERVAAFEGAVGLGITMGYILSSIIRQYVGYSYYFLILMVLHVFALFYIIAFAEELDGPENDEPLFTTSTISSHFTDVYHFIQSYRNHPCFHLLSLILISICFELLFNIGVDDILYSYLRYKLSWDDKPYGWYNGIGCALNSLTILFLYPYLHRTKNINDVMLAIYGFISRVAILLMFAFLFSNWLAYLALIPTAFTRFILTGLRASSSKFVDDNEQGKLFSLISVIEGIMSLAATLIFNGLYPLTLSFFSGTIFLVVAVLCLIPIALLLKVHNKMELNEEETTPFNQPLAVNFEQ
uniref:Proton-coupled folate transporter n=1 Tax=Panagrolaimus davidi TaxID=227884 RepID=A0A914Q0H8_9BILA